MTPSGSGPHTWDDFIALDDDDPRELIDGWLVDPEDTEVHPSTAPGPDEIRACCKREIYRTVGVAECWFIEPETAILERYTLVPERGTDLIRPIAADTNLQPEGFPGLEIPLAELWTTER